MAENNKKIDIADLSPENFWLIKVALYALSERLGPFKFSNANRKLEKIQKWLKEAKDLGYQSELSKEAQMHIDKYITEFIENIRWMADFDLGREGSFNFKQEHKNFEDKIDSFFNKVQVNLKEKYLPILWINVARETGGAQELDNELKATRKARKQAEEITKTLQSDLAEIKAEKKKIESGALELGSARMAAYFDKEVEKYEKQTKVWLGFGIASYLLLATVVIWAISLLWDEAGTIPWQRLVLKAAIFAVLWYVVAFIARNYNVSSNLGAVNRHRAAVARTLEDYVRGNPQRQNEMWKNATEAMFQHLAIGYITKSEKDQGNPIYEIINNITKQG